MAYARNYPLSTLATDMSPVNRPFSNGLIENLDIAEHSPLFPGIGQSSASQGIHLSGDNDQLWDTTGWIVRNCTVRGYETDPTKAFAHCFRSKWNARNIWEGNDGDLSTDACFRMTLSKVMKYIDLPDSTGNWKLADHFAFSTAPTTSLGCVLKIDDLAPGVRLWYASPTSQDGTPPDIAGPATIVNMDDTGTGTLGVGGSVNAGQTGPNVVIRRSTERRSRFGSSGGTVRWLTMDTSATLGTLIVDPATEYRVPFAFFNESDSDFIGPSDDYVGFDIASFPGQGFTAYTGNSADNCSFGVGSARLAS